MRADEVRDVLWEVCDGKLEDAVQERDHIVADSWVPDHALIASVGRWLHTLEPPPRLKARSVFSA